MQEIINYGLGNNEILSMIRDFPIEISEYHIVLIKRDKQKRKRTISITKEMKADYKINNNKLVTTKKDFSSIRINYVLDKKDYEQIKELDILNITLNTKIQVNNFLENIYSKFRKREFLFYEVNFEGKGIKFNIKPYYDKKIIKKLEVKIEDSLYINHENYFENIRRIIEAKDQPRWKNLR